MDFITNFVPAKMMGDLSFVIVFLVLTVVLALYFGRPRLTSLMMYCYIDTAILSVLPVTFFAMSPYGKVFVFFAIYIFLFLVGDYLLNIHVSSGGGDSFWRTLVMSFLTVGMFASIVFALLPRSFTLSYVSSATASYFYSQLSQIVWMILPLFFLLFANKRLR